MESKDPFDAVRSMMEDNLAKVGSATKNYLDLLQKSMLNVPNANEDQVNAFRAYIGRQVAANQAFVSKLLGAKNIQEAMQIQVEYFQSQMRTAVNDAMQLTDKMAASSKRSAG
ncbi:phasin family protein [Bradyrhizobium sp. MOS002]|uniref:phasin family protein n=1 Tax=Bradyrhizobium sp. MOS002 TaxID=2133947 RepID=UPI001304AE2D|nr:phasin family protein [Bradyrhizobium sp. MOS002]